MNQGLEKIKEVANCYPEGVFPEIEKSKCKGPEAGGCEQNGVGESKPGRRRGAVVGHRTWKAKVRTSWFDVLALPHRWED